MVTSTARTIDLVTAYVMEDAVAATGFTQSPPVSDGLARPLFFADRVWTDVTSDTATFSLIGPESDALLDQLGAGAITGNLCHSPAGADGKCEVRVAVGSGLAIPGYTLIAQLKTRLRFGAVLSKLGQYHWASVSGNSCRTRTPSPDQELSDDYNPLEAGLWQTISFEKGCYIVRKPSPV